MSSLKQHFLLDPNVVFLNHGSYGATPIPVFEAYQDWQRRLERQPVLFLGRQFNELVWEARTALGEYLHADPDDLAYIPNATHGVNIIAHSLQLQPGEEILTSDHEYGACDYTWEFVCTRTGARYIHQPLPLPVQTGDEIVEQLWQGVTPRTRVIYLSHITSATALRLPVEQICRRARQAGILTVIDAAHSPGQIPLDLHELGADILFGNCHKHQFSIYFVTPSLVEKSHLDELLCEPPGQAVSNVQATAKQPFAEGFDILRIVGNFQAGKR